MPLSKSVSRKLIHRREIVCHGYERDDGLWDIEGRITDTKTYSIENKDRGSIPAGDPIHEMVVRLTVDTGLNVVEAEAVTENAPFTICPAITGGIKSLKGERIAPGWTKAVKSKIGGLAGCTHINQLLMGPLATTAYQAIVPRMSRDARKKDPDRRPAVIGTCHAWAADGPIVKREYPQFYKGPEDQTAAG